MNITKIIVSFVKHLFKLQFLIILLSILIGLYYPQIKDKLSDYISEYIWIPIVLSMNNPTTTDNLKTVVSQFKPKEYLFTKDNLAQYNGLDMQKAIYLSILGNVYDVTKGRKHYGIGCAYGTFAGRDASVHFISGNFDECNDCDDVLQLSNSDLYSLANWKKFYDKEYTYVGKLIGRFYDINGDKTNYYHQFDEIIKIAEIEKQENIKIQEKYPPCNIEWSAESGTRVWCTNQSGGKVRSWIGVPRKFYETPEKSFKCVCVNDHDLNKPQFQLYENCNTKSVECYYKVDD